MKKENSPPAKPASGGRDSLTLRLGLLHEELDRSIKKFEGRRKRNAKMGVVVKLLSLGLSAVVTVLLGLGGADADYLLYGRAALILSAMTGVVSGISVFFDFNDLALKYKDTVDKLGIIKIKLRYLETGGKNSPAEAEEVDALKDEYISTLKETYEFFQAVRKDESDSTGKDTEE